MGPLMDFVHRQLGDLARQLLPDSLFGRLALLLVVAVVSSHVPALTLMFELNPFPPPPPPFGGPGGPPHRFPPGLLIDISVRLALLILAAWVGASWLSEPVCKLAAAKALGQDIYQPVMPEDGPRHCAKTWRHTDAGQSLGRWFGGHAAPAAPAITQQRFSHSATVAKSTCGRSCRVDAEFCTQLVDGGA